MKLFPYLKSFVLNPSLFLRKVLLRCINPFLRFKSPIQNKKIDGVIFTFDLRNPNMRQMYLGVYEVETVKILKKYLKSGDIFINVGANVGYLTAIGASCVDKIGQVHSFEPVPLYFAKLKDLADRNKNFNIFVNNCAVGDKEGMAIINVGNDSNIGWNTMVPGFMNTQTIKESIRVPVIRLDKYINDKQIEKQKISLILIDVEGYEFPVLKGLESFLNKYHPTILCEIAPGAYPLMGTDLKELYEYMIQFSYSSFNLNYKHLDIEKLTETTNVLFISTK